MRARSPTRDQHRIAEALSHLLETHVDPFDIEVYAARGYWAHTHQDVQRWTGSIKINARHYSLGSWNLTLSDLRRGRPFEVFDGRDSPYSDNSFQFEPINTSKDQDHAE